MSLKDILVILGTSSNNTSRLDVAINLAQTYDAHLTGLFVRSTPQVPQYIMSQLGEEVAKMQRLWSQEAADQAKAVFDEKTRAVGLKTEWRAVDGQLVNQATLHAKYTDLVVAGQFDPDSETVDGEETLIDHLVLEAGRPVLVVPYAGKFTSIGTRPMVAWNATREATRAVNDALPLLKNASLVRVVAVNPRNGHGRDGHGAIPSADICLHLARHDVKAEAQHIEARDIDVGSALLSHATDEAVDLMVMGAYGRSRLRELVLGGATRHFLRQMTIPVLMSH